MDKHQSARVSGAAMAEGRVHYLHAPTSRDDTHRAQGGGARTERTPLPQAYLQQPPHLRGKIPVVAADVLAPEAEPAPYGRARGELTCPPAPLQFDLHDAIARQRSRPKPKPGFWTRLFGGQR